MGKRSTKDALRRFGRQKFDAKGPAVQELFAELNSASDRAAAIILGTLVEEALRSAIYSKFQTLSPEDEDRIFNGGGLGPLSTFASRILVGYAMAVITNTQRHDLDYIKEIRNAFAHSLVGLSFENPVISDACSQLQVIDLAKLPPVQHTAKWRFMVSCAAIMSQLSGQFARLSLGPIPIGNLIAGEPHGSED